MTAPAELPFEFYLALRREDHASVHRARLDSETAEQVDDLAREVLRRGHFGEVPNAWEIMAALGAAAWFMPAAADDGELRLTVSRWTVARGDIPPGLELSITSRVDARRRAELAVLGVAYVALVRRGITDRRNVDHAIAAAARLARELLMPAPTVRASLERGEDLRAVFPDVPRDLVRARLRDLRGRPALAARAA